MMWKIGTLSPIPFFFCSVALDSSIVAGSIGLAGALCGMLRRQGYPLVVEHY